MGIFSTHQYARSNWQGAACARRLASPSERTDLVTDTFVLHGNRPHRASVRRIFVISEYVLSNREAVREGAFPVLGWRDRSSSLRNTAWAFSQGQDTESLSTISQPAAW